MSFLPASTSSNLCWFPASSYTTSVVAFCKGVPSCKFVLSSMSGRELGLFDFLSPERVGGLELGCSCGRCFGCCFCATVIGINVLLARNEESFETRVARNNSFGYSYSQTISFPGVTSNTRPFSPLQISVFPFDNLSAPEICPEKNEVGGSPSYSQTTSFVLGFNSITLDDLLCRDPLLKIRMFPFVKNRVSCCPLSLPKPHRYLIPSSESF